MRRGRHKLCQRTGIVHVGDDGEVEEAANRRVPSVSERRVRVTASVREKRRRGAGGVCAGPVARGGEADLAAEKRAESGGAGCCYWATQAMLGRAEKEQRARPAGRGREAERLGPAGRMEREKSCFFAFISKLF